MYVYACLPANLLAGLSVCLSGLVFLVWSGRVGSGLLCLCLVCLFVRLSVRLYAWTEKPVGATGIYRSKQVS